MVYMEPCHLGWECLLTSWAEKMEGQIIEPYLSKAKDMLFIILTKLLDAIRKDKKYKEVIVSVDSNLVKSCLNFVSIFLDKERISLDKPDKVPFPDKAVCCYVAFAIMWSLGANLHDDSKGYFNTQFKLEVQKHMSELPNGDVFDYGLNADH